MGTRGSGTEPTLARVVRGSVDAEGERVSLESDRGMIDCRYHRADGGRVAVMWLSGTGGGLAGPAAGLYPRLARALVSKGIASLRLECRRPGRLRESVLDACLGVGFLVGEWRDRVVLVGHAFGGAVAIRAGAACEQVIGVAALSCQPSGTRQVRALAPRPLLLVHGGTDEIVWHTHSAGILARAGKPKRLVLYPDGGHDLDECRVALEAELGAWIEEVAAGGRPG